MRPLSGLILAGAVVISACGGPAPPPFRPVVDTNLLMHQLFTVGGDVYEACSNCYRQYLDAIVNANK